MKKTKIIIPALGLLLLSTAASVTGTVAWFSANSVATVNGMEVKTKVSSNLLVSATNSEAMFAANLTQSRSALLEPVSSVNATSFFYHNNDNIDGNGKASDAAFTAYNENVALTNTGADKTNVDFNFNKRYGVKGTGDTDTGNEQSDWIANITDANKTSLVAPAYGYVDYVFYLKATSSEDNAKVELTRVNLMYDDAAISGTEKAWRVGIFKEVVSQGAAGSAIESMTNVSILGLDGATYAYTTNQAASTASSRGTVTTFQSEAEIDGDIDAGITRYYKFAARLWLEGEDTTCNNATYADLTSSWKLELEFKLDTTSDGAQMITSETSIFAGA